MVAIGSQSWAALPLTPRCEGACGDEAAQQLHQWHCSSRPPLHNASNKHQLQCCRSHQGDLGSATACCLLNLRHHLHLPARGPLLAVAFRASVSGAMVNWLRAATMVITVVIIGVVVICACGNPNKNDPLGVLNRFFTRTLPNAVRALVKATGTEWVLKAGHKVYAWFFLQRNPFVMIGYFILILGGFGVFLWKGYPRLPNDYLPAWHKPIGLVVMASCLASFIAAAATNPGRITPDTLSQFARWSYDGVLYEKRVCATCGTVKPARSKHCKIMGQCVSRFDHYCIWLNTAVGERNYRYFLAFLIIHVGMLWYGAVAALTIFAQEAEDKGLWRATFVKRSTNETITATTWIVVQFLMSENYELSMCLMLCLVMGTVLAAFTGYHLWLAGTNVTTNEMMKWGDVERYRDFCVRRRAMAEERLQPLTERIATLAARLSKQKAALGLGGAGATGPGRTLSSGAHEGEVDKEAALKATAEAEARLGDLEEVRKEMEEVLATPLETAPMVNRYNRGMVNNFMEAFFPLCDRSEGDLPEGDWLAAWGSEDLSIPAGTVAEDGSNTLPPAKAAPKEAGSVRKRGKKGKKKR